MPRPIACAHNVHSMTALAEELTHIGVQIKKLAEELEGLDRTILIDNQSSVEKALVELMKFKNKASIQIEERKYEIKVQSLNPARQSD